MHKNRSRSMREVPSPASPSAQQPNAGTGQATSWECCVRNAGHQLKVLCDMIRRLAEIMNLICSKELPWKNRGFQRLKFQKNGSAASSVTIQRLPFGGSRFLIAVS